MLPPAQYYAHSAQKCFIMRKQPVRSSLEVQCNMICWLDHELEAIRFRTTKSIMKSVQFLFGASEVSLISRHQKCAVGISGHWVSKSFKAELTNTDRSYPIHCHIFRSYLHSWPFTCLSQRFLDVPRSHRCPAFLPLTSTSASPTWMRKKCSPHSSFGPPHVHIPIASHSHSP